MCHAAGSAVSVQGEAARVGRVSQAHEEGNGAAGARRQALRKHLDVLENYLPTFSLPWVVASSSTR